MNALANIVINIIIIILSSSFLDVINLSVGVLVVVFDARLAGLVTAVRYVSLFLFVKRSPWR